MVSVSNSVLFPLATSSGFTSDGFSRSVRFARTINWCSSDKQKGEHRNVLCACAEPPPKLRSDESFATKFEDSFKSEDLSTVREPEDESDVLIECRDVYKSFGEKHVLRGVSFKLIAVNDIYM